MGNIYIYIYIYATIRVHKWKFTFNWQQALFLHNHHARAALGGFARATFWSNRQFVNAITAFRTLNIQLSPTKCFGRFAGISRFYLWVTLLWNRWTYRGLHTTNQVPEFIHINWRNWVFQSKVCNISTSNKTP